MYVLQCVFLKIKKKMFLLYKVKLHFLIILNSIPIGTG